MKRRCYRLRVYLTIEEHGHGSEDDNELPMEDDGNLWRGSPLEMLKANELARRLESLWKSHLRK
jgi:hypothetical protein